MADPTPMDPDVLDETLALVAQVDDLEAIASETDYAHAAELLKGAVTLRKRIEDWFKPLLDAQQQALNTLKARKQQELQHVVFVEERLRPALAAYAQGVEARRKAAEQAALAQARDAAEAAKAAQIAKATAQGDTAGAHAIAARPTILVVPKPEIKPVPKVTGIGTRETWSARVTNLQDLIMAASLHPHLYAQFLQPNDVTLNAQARRLKAELNIPGVDAVRTTGTTVSTQ
jgi:hypothetical protein